MRRLPSVRGLVICLILAVPGFAYLRIPREWDARSMVHVTGDEPHYLVVADAIARDHRLTVDAAYARDERSHAIYGPIDWQAHTRARPSGTFSVHNVGVPAILAPAFARWGLSGARATLALIAALIPFLFYGLARQTAIGRAAATALAFCAAFGLPFLAASGQIYPDLTTGVLLLSLTLLVLATAARPLPTIALLLAGALLACLPWLHLKNLGAMVCFAGSLLFLEFRRRGSGVTTLGRSAAIAVPILGSVGLLAYYNLIAFDSIGGPYESHDAGATIRQASMIFLGLHLDQAQGLFIQQPLFLLALAGLPLFIRRTPLVAATVIAAYGSIVVPNAFHPCWYGCASFSGRFVWSVAALWFLPLVALFRELHARERFVAAAVGGLGIGWQLWLMPAWRETPSILYPRMAASLAERNSLFPPAWRSVLPSFYDFDRYHARPTNLLALALVAGLLGIGVWLSWRRRKPAEARTGSWLLPVVLAPVLATIVLSVAIHASAARTIDLVEQFPAADRRPIGAGSETFDVRSETIGGETKRAIYAHPPSRITWNVVMPEDAQLTAWLGVDERAWTQDGDGVVFRIGIGDDQGYREWVTQRVNPRKSADDRRWLPVSVDLSRYGGKRVSVIFNTDWGTPGSRDARHDEAYWALPSIRNRCP